MNTLQLKLKRDVAIVIPVLNEEKALRKVLKEIVNEGISPENILVVDGGSTDKSREIAISEGVKVINQKGSGKANAIATCLRYIPFKYTLLMDGDYTYPAKYIKELYRMICKSYDMVIGSRVFREETQKLLYKIGNIFLSKLFNFLFRVNLSDVLSGMYIIKTDVLKEISFETSGFSVEVEIVAHVVSRGKKIAEVPIQYRRRIGKKKLRIFHGFQIAFDIVRLALQYKSFIRVQS